MYRYDIINHFIEKYNFKRYLEIGVFDGECIRLVKCEHKDGVDSCFEGRIAPETNYKMTSDEFFNTIAPTVEKYDIVFIDGLHHSEQVDLDIENALKYTNDNGVVLLHDCNPPTKGHASRPRSQEEWNGDVYKSILKLQKNNSEYNYCTIDSDWGVGVIDKNKKRVKCDNTVDIATAIIDWEYFDKNRVVLLNLINVLDFKNKY
jgi:hypothetical protein